MMAQRFAIGNLAVLDFEKRRLERAPRENGCCHDLDAKFLEAERMPGAKVGLRWVRATEGREMTVAERRKATKSAVAQACTCVVQ